MMAKDYGRNFSLINDNGVGFTVAHLPDRKRPILAVPDGEGAWIKVASFDSEEKYKLFVMELEKLYGEPEDVD